MENKKEILKRIELIESSKELTSEFRKKYATDFTLVKASVKENLIKEEAIKLIKNLTVGWVS